MIRQILVEIIDLEKYRAAIDLERAKVMLFVWIVGMAKVVIDFDGPDDARDCFGAERSNAYRHDRMAMTEILSQLVVESSNAVGLRGSGLGRQVCLRWDW